VTSDQSHAKISGRRPSLMFTILSFLHIHARP
jgi:hypothetical protein